MAAHSEASESTRSCPYEECKCERCRAASSSDEAANNSHLPRLLPQPGPAGTPAGL